MTSNGNGVEVRVASTEELEDAHGDDTHLQVIISQTTYDAVMNVMNRDRERSRTTGKTFDQWLEKLVTTGERTVLSVWDRSDLAIILSNAKKGNHKAIETLKRMFPDIVSAR